MCAVPPANSVRKEKVGKRLHSVVDCTNCKVQLVFAFQHNIVVNALNLIIEGKKYLIVILFKGRHDEASKDHKKNVPKEKAS